MDLNNDFYEDDGIIHNVDIIHGAYINFIVYEDKFVIECNVDGLKSFINILDRILYKSNCFARLTGFQYSDSYTNTTECFFEEKSDILELSKIETINSNIYYDDLGVYPYGGEKQVRLEMSSDTYRNIKDNVCDIINNKYNSIILNTIGKTKNNSKQFYINLVNKKSPRMC